MNFCIETAGLRVAVESVYDGVYRHCRDYLCQENRNPDFSVKTDLELLHAEFDAMMEQEHIAPGPRGIELYAVHRLICNKALDFGVFMMHGATVAVNGGAYLFSAPSGTGKTTHIRLWLENLPEAYVVNGDKPFLRVTEEGVLACGSPWCGKESLGRNTQVPLKAIVFMERGGENSIRKVPFKEVFPRLLQQVYRPQNAEGMRKTLEMLKSLPEKVTFYSFQFDNFKDDCFDTAYNALVKDRP